MRAGWRTATVLVCLTCLASSGLLVRGQSAPGGEPAPTSGGTGCTCAPAPGPAAGPPLANYSYADFGYDWGRQGFPECNGKRQSPINILTKLFQNTTVSTAAGSSFGTGKNVNVSYLRLLGWGSVGLHAASVLLHCFGLGKA